MKNEIKNVSYSNIDLNKTSKKSPKLQFQVEHLK